MGDVLLDTASVKDYREKMAQWAEVVRSMDLQGSMGVYARRNPTVGMDIYLSKQDSDD